MGLPAQPLTTVPFLRPLGRRGIAMFGALVGVVALSVLVVGLFTMVDLHARAVRNREEAARARQLAEAGAAHAIGVLRTHFAGMAPTDVLRRERRHRGRWVARRLRSCERGGDSGLWSEL